VIARQFQIVAAAQPDSPAIREPGGAWSYGEIARAAARLAARLPGADGRRVGVQASHFAVRLAALLALDAVAAEACVLPATGGPSLADLQLDDLISDDSSTDPRLADLWSTGEAPMMPVSAGDGRVVLLTSGTSGPPKPVLHTWRSLTSAVHSGESHRGRRWLLAYDSSSFAGLQVWLQALLTGGRLSCPPLGDPAAVVRALVDDGVECISATPTFWRMLLAATSADDWTGVALRRITLGGEAVGQGILDALSERFPAAQVTHIYASTEMGVCFSVHDRREGFPASYLDRDELPCSLMVSDQGELLIQSQRAMQQMENRQTADEWFATGDMVRVAGDRVLFVGRKSGTINVGGSKVMPEEVEEVIRGVPGVLEVRVEGVASSLVGELVCAHVAVSDDADRRTLREAILAVCRESLPKHKRPALVEFESALESTHSGKLARATGDPQ
jgi:acyl-CoA synthetase (AMP-forming)/AMP-acid ligase II